jgi:hypothetical protein
MVRTGGSQRNPEVRQRTVEREHQICELRLQSTRRLRISGASVSLGPSFIKRLSEYSAYDGASEAHSFSDKSLIEKTSRNPRGFAS